MPVRLANELLQFVPIDFDVEIHPNPTLNAHIRRTKEPVGISRDERFLASFGSSQPNGDANIMMVICQ